MARRYLQLVNPTVGANKHYFIAILKRSDTDFRMVIGHGRIGKKVMDYMSNGYPNFESAQEAMRVRHLAKMHRGYKDMEPAKAVGGIPGWFADPADNRWEQKAVRKASIKREHAAWDF